MAERRDRFGLALDTLRADLRDGAVETAAALNTTDLAKALKISATPIREALSRLAGEGLLSDRRGRGYFPLRYDALDVQDLYRLHASQIALAMELGRARGGGPFGEPPNPFPIRDGRLYRERCERLWGGLIAAGANRALHRAHLALSDQLAPLRLIEWSHMADGLAELVGLEAALDAKDASTLRRMVQGYHKRRIASAQILAAAFRDRMNIARL